MMTSFVRLLLPALLPALLGFQPGGGINTKKIYFSNPSFEGVGRASASPEGWSSFTLGSTPDILPGAWGIRHVAAQEGQTCLGLVTREDGSYEDVAQSLPEILKADSCYTFSIYLAHTDKYVGFNQPIRLRVWGGGSKAKEVLLATSPLIDHAEWRTYTFQFVPKRNVRVITLEAYYGPGVTFKYRGNILLDNCSPIERCDRA